MIPSCTKCSINNLNSEIQPKSVGHGFFIRTSDRAIIRRFRCCQCLSTFSEATPSACYNQKKRHLNREIFVDLASGISQRRLARKLSCNRKTIVRKLIFLGIQSKKIVSLSNKLSPKVLQWQFDDLETFEHSKLKPLSIILAVEEDSRRILGFEVAEMPAKGLLAIKSRKKYGKRKDGRLVARQKLFNRIKETISDTSTAKSDQNPHYQSCFNKIFPGSRLVTYKSQRGCVVGQGELKALRWDPIFSINHTFAMCRANVNRLFRRTWNTTKKSLYLDYHMAIYVAYHNEVLIKWPSTPKKSYK